MRRKIGSEVKSEDKPQLSVREQKIQDFKKIHRIFSILGLFLLGYLLFFEMKISANVNLLETKKEKEEAAKRVAIDSPEIEIVDSVAFNDPLKINERMKRFNDVFSAISTKEYTSITEGTGVGLPKDCRDIERLQVSVFDADSGRLIESNNNVGPIDIISLAGYHPGLAQSVIGMKENQVKWVYIPALKLDSGNAKSGKNELSEKPLIARIHLVNQHLTSEMLAEFNKDKDKNLVDVKIGKALGCPVADYEAQKPETPEAEKAKGS
jgi:hypothetical protein